MTWLDDFYNSSVAIPLSLVALAVISLLSWRKRGHQIILALTLFLYARYLLWRGLYTLNTSDWASLLMSWTVYTAEAYAFVQILLLAYHAWSPLERQPVPLNRYPIVDIAGHSEVAPGRKTDPGPHFDWPLFRSLVEP